VASAFTHLLVGAGIGSAAGAAPSARIYLRPCTLPLASAVLSALPDADVLMHRWVEYAHPFGHRGAFHSLGFSLLLAALAATPIASRRQPRLRLIAFAAFFAALASHPLLDMLTDGGLGIAILWPLTDARYFWPWRPIPVSPISIPAFFGEWGLRVLAVEVWFALPPFLTGLAVRRGILRRAQTQPS
jgi:inner membrane protein